MSVMRRLARSGQGLIRTESLRTVLITVNALYSGATLVAIPLTLNEAGLSKSAIACYFVACAALAAILNLVVLDWLLARLSATVVLRWTTLAVPVGTVVLAKSAGHLLLLYSGALFLLFVTTVPAQIFRALEGPERYVNRALISLRQFMVAGYILGLAFFAAATAVDISPLLAAAALALVAFVISCFMKQPAKAAIASRASGTALPSTKGASVGLVVALSLVGLMRAVDAIRSIYLPLYGAGSGIDPQLIGILFVVSAVCELGVLQLLRRVKERRSSAFILAVVTLFGLCSFALLLGSSTVGGLLVSQVTYAVFGAGFQGVGLVLLTQVVHHNVGRGAAYYMAVMQVGTVIGAVLPLAQPGYGAGIFWSALALCMICLALTGVLARVLPRKAVA